MLAVVVVGSIMTMCDVVSGGLLFSFVVGVEAPGYSSNGSVSECAERNGLLGSEDQGELWKQAFEPASAPSSREA